jgi:hypothetical protein
VPLAGQYAGRKRDPYAKNAALAQGPEKHLYGDDVGNEADKRTGQGRHGELEEHFH